MTTTQIENILACYSRGTFADIRSGANWYDAAHNLALELSPNDVMRGAGVISAYSPLMPWKRNEELAIDSLRTGIARTDALGTSVRAAQRILDGEHTMSVLNGDKTRAFAAAIADPKGSTIATIDRHAHDIAMGRVFENNTRKIGKRVYREMSVSYGIAAKELGFSVAQTQAIVWVIWRNEKGII